MSQVKLARIGFPPCYFNYQHLIASAREHLHSQYKSSQQLQKLVKWALAICCFNLVLSNWLPIKHLMKFLKDQSLWFWWDCWAFDLTCSGGYVECCDLVDCAWTGILWFLNSWAMELGDAKEPDKVLYVLLIMACADWRVWSAAQLGRAMNEPKVPLCSWRWCPALRLDRSSFRSSGCPELGCTPSARWNA